MKINVVSVGSPVITLSKYKIVKDPVHGYIKLYQHEIPIIDSYPFQRLRRLKQLAVADFVYPGAVHTRFSHSLGVAHVAETMVKEILSKTKMHVSDIERYVVILRLVALLHDIGHGPFSHTFEDYVLYPRNVTHEIMGAKIIEKHETLAPILEKILAEYGYKLKDLTQALTSSTADEWPFKETLPEGNTKALFYVIKGAFCADLVDYLLRDSYFTGAGYGSGIDWYRIAHFTYLEGDKLAVDVKALEVLDQILIARLFMFSTVYYHKTVRAAAKFVGNILRKIDRLKILDFDAIIDDIHKYIALDDYSIFLHSDVAKLEEVHEFLSRRIPYKSISEHRIMMPESIKSLEILLSLSREYVENLIEERMRSCGIELKRDEDFFIDTPRLPLNPMLGDEVIYVRDSTGNIIRKSVLELTWFQIPKTIAVIRLYIHRSKLEYADRLKQVFRSIFESGELRSFY